MTMKIKPIWMLILALGCSHVNAQPYQPQWESLEQRGIPEWFHQDKFGIFIHWGMYAVPAYAPAIKNSGESYSEWYWYRLHEGNERFRAFHDQHYGRNHSYPDFEKDFTTELYNPEHWASIFKRSGAKYVVLTSKHHDGYCLWPSEEADRHWGRPWNAVSGTPGRDLLGELTDAVRGAGLRMGFYYSLYEWFNPLWQTDRQLFVNKHMIPQLKDLVTRYKPSLIFSDGEWDMEHDDWRSEEVLAWLFNESPVADEVVVNDRWGKHTRGKYNGALYTTSEYGSGMDASIIWEESQGIGNSYGYNRNESIDDYKSGLELKLLLVDVVARGGNLLLNIGPRADGRIPVYMEQCLLEIGSWLETHGEAIYGTTAYKTPYQWSAGKPRERQEGHYMSGYNVADFVKKDGEYAHIEAFFTKKDRDLYCIVPGIAGDTFVLRDVEMPEAAKATLVGTGKELAVTQMGSDCHIDLSGIRPGELNDQLFVIKLENAW